eukprot:TRINITY_DN8596_c0_g3_i3.p1 TRINITY_DN8596_c0_g3~~TRINITY_DN8596_c0_g3_i3.p1  ORF type:complete len:310 (+),score=58.38 TRINITY_DN8596_c0_g3_i3:48-977(+)
MLTSGGSVPIIHVADDGGRSASVVEANIAAPFPLVAYGSFQGSVADTARRRSQRMSQVSNTTRSTDVTDIVDLPNEGDWEPHGGRKFLKNPDKGPLKLKRMSSIVDTDETGSPKNTDKPGFQSFGAFSDEGYNASYNQDALLMVTSVANVPNTALFGVFDGHGNHGDKVANFAKDTLYKVFLSKYSKDGKPLPSEEILQIFRQVFLETQAEMEKQGDLFLLAGTTASIVFIQERIMYAAHVGDSRVVLGRECASCVRLNAFHAGQGTATTIKPHMTSIQVTRDHRVGEIKEERDRVEKVMCMKTTIIMQ